MMRSTQILTAARSLIQTEETWTREAFARKSPRDPKAVPFHSTEATCFCSLGALRKAGTAFGTLYDEDFNIARARLGSAARGLLSNSYSGESGPIIHLNDNGSHERVLRMFDIAIANETREKKDV